MPSSLDDILTSTDGYKMPDPSSAADSTTGDKAADDYLRQRREATAPVETAIEKGIKQRDALMSKPVGPPAAPKLQDVPTAPNSRFQDPMQVFLNPAVVMATLGSLFTRQPLIAAMNAAGSAMEGFHKGDVERVKLEREKWKDNVDRALKQNQIELEKYKVAMDKANLSITERSARMQAIAASVNDQQMLGALRSGNLDVAWHLREAREKSQFELKRLSAEEDHRRETEARMREQLAETKRHHEADEAHKAELLKTGGLSDEAVDLAAHRVMAGDPKALTNIGRGAQSGVNLARIQNRVAELGGDPVQAAETIKRAQAKFAGDLAGERVLGVRGKNLELAENEARTLIPRVLEASEKVNRTDYPTLNKLIEAAQTGTGDANVIKLGIAAASLITVYARILKPSGQITEGDTKRAEDILNIAWSKGQIRGALEQMQVELDAAKKGLEMTKAGGKPEASAYQAPAPGSVIKYDAQGNRVQ